MRFLKRELAVPRAPSLELRVSDGFDVGRVLARWVIGWLALGVQAGLLGLRIVLARWFLAGAGGVYSVELSKFDDALGL